MLKLYTYGYHGGDGQRLAELIAAGALLMDVRFNPYGKVPGFNREELIRRYGRQYAHVRELGNRNFRGGPIELANEAAGVRKVCEALRRGRTLILMCACGNPQACHRSYAAQRIQEAMGGPGELEIEHLRRVEQPDPQGLLFSWK